MSDEDDAVVAALQSVFGPGIARRLTTLLARPPSPDPAFPELTAREREVLELISRGLANTAIARQLVISPKTVRNHISSIFAKLQVEARGEAIALARDAGLGGR